MIEPLKLGSEEWGHDCRPSVLAEKVNEIITVVNRLEQLAKLNLGAPNDGRPHPMQGEMQRSENDLTWPKDTSILGDQPTSVQHTKKDGPKQGPGIVRRAKEKP